MREIDINPQTTPDYQLVNAALALEKNGHIWIKIDDPFSPRHGTIGRLVSTKYLKELNKNKNSVSQSATPLSNKQRWSFETVLKSKLQDFQIGPKKFISPQLARFFIKWLPDYTGPYVDCYDKDVSKNEFFLYDLLDNRIEVGAFVAASGGSGMFLGTVEEIYADRKDHAITLRANIRVMYTTPPDPNYSWVRPTHSTVNVQNLIVITDKIKQQAMMAKLAKV